MAPVHNASSTPPLPPSSPRRRTERLHLGRLSAAGARYFVTFITQGRIPWLATPLAREAMLTVLLNWHRENDGRLLVATVMPDHVHAVFQLGNLLDVGRCVARWKAQARRAAGYPGDWQRDFWEHRIRDDEVFDDYGLYLLSNPYRARLVGVDEGWSGWCCPSPVAFGFMAALNAQGIPPREWMDWPAERFDALATGEMLG